MTTMGNRRYTPEFKRDVLGMASSGETVEVAGRTA
jgi:transposase-like protein